MRISWSIDGDQGLVGVTYSGEPDFAAWSTAMLEIFEHPEYRPGLGFVIDFGDFLVPDTQDVKKVVAFLSRHRAEIAGARLAHVTRDPVHYGMTRMGQAFLEEEPILVETFATFEEAEEWAKGSGDT